MVKFSEANVKIQALSQVESVAKYLENGRKVYSFDLLSGHSCPFASQCKSKVVLVEGKRTIQDGPNTEFRCFSASQEVVYTNLYNLRANNFKTMRAMDDSRDMADAINAAMPSDLGVCRIHVGGDFFNRVYFDAWILVAKSNPDKLFYAYTKSLRYWVDRMDDIPSNLILTASYGGLDDDMIEEYQLRSSKVVFSVEQAEAMGLEIDHDDSHAADPTKKFKDFALLIHGVQPKGSEASEAIKQLKKNNVQFSYSR
jgi:hypothetical protein